MNILEILHLSNIREPPNIEILLNSILFALIVL